MKQATWSKELDLLIKRKHMLEDRRDALLKQLENTKEDLAYYNKCIAEHFTINHKE